MLSLTAIVKSDNGPFLEDSGLGETLTNAFTLGFFSEMISRCSHRVEMDRERRVLAKRLVALVFIVPNESATKRAEEVRALGWIMEVKFIRNSRQILEPRRSRSSVGTNTHEHHAISASGCLPSARINNYRLYFSMAKSGPGTCLGPAISLAITANVSISSQNSLFHKMAKTTPVNASKDRPAKKARVEAPYNSKTRTKQPRPLRLAPTKKMPDTVEPIPASVKGKEKELKTAPKIKKKKLQEVVQLPTSFKIVAGSYEKLLYGLDGIVTVEDSKLEFHLKPTFIFPAHVSCIKAVAASPQGGKWLASGSADEIIKVWDLRRRKEIGGLMHHEGTRRCHSCVFSN